MSGTKISIIIIVIIVVIGGMWWYNTQSQTPSTTNPNDTTTTTSDNNPYGSTLDATVKASGSSNASLDKDMTSVDTQLKALDNDSANANAGLNDKSVDQ